MVNGRLTIIMVKRFRQVTIESPNNVITCNANNQRIMYDMYRDLKVKLPPISIIRLFLLTYLW